MALHAQAQRRHRAILGRCLERLAARLQRGALRAWRERALQRRVRRVALERFTGKAQAAVARRALLRRGTLTKPHRHGECPFPQ